MSLSTGSAVIVLDNIKDFEDFRNMKAWIS
jgi:hypothetical protein